MERDEYACQQCFGQMTAFMANPTKESRQRWEDYVEACAQIDKSTWTEANMKMKCLTCGIAQRKMYNGYRSFFFMPNASFK